MTNPSSIEKVRISRERKALISQYATSAVLLYGIISIDEFVAVFNHYETITTSDVETKLALVRFSRTDDVEYTVWGDLLLGPFFLPDFEDDMKIVKIFRANQQGKPRYLPKKEEFLKYTNADYREPQKPFDDLRSYIIKHKLTQKGEGLEGVDGDLLDLHEMMQFGLNLSDELRYFIDQGYRIGDLDDLNDFTQLIINAHNNTRMYENNGYTPNDLSKLSKHQRNRSETK